MISSIRYVKIITEFEVMCLSFAENFSVWKVYGQMARKIYNSTTYGQVIIINRIWYNNYK